ncbi:MAG: hypothetical protein JWR42_987 [Marmoricola sp.]|nr:hypothetical protein [Marmoricola sp.]
MSRQKLEPDASHPITVTPTRGRVRVRVGDTVVADTTRALTLAEASYPAAYYVPRSEIDPALLVPSQTQTWCPYKGEASYVDLDLPTGRVADAAWTYPQPHAAVAEIEGHLAFYPDKAEVELLG